jgi:tRNA modification GTPase
MYTEGTIIALSSPPGSGAISIIRLSGEDAISITDKVLILINHYQNLKVKV